MLRLFMPARSARPALTMGIVAISLAGPPGLPCAEPSAPPTLPPASRPARAPLFHAIDLRSGEAREVELGDGSRAKVKLLAVEETRDSLRDAVRRARVRVEVNGEEGWVPSANYSLPVTVGGVKLDCPITRGVLSNADGDVWALERDARLRLWPIRSPLLAPGTFAYPVRQRWFASRTQMANEPVHVDGGESPKRRSIYYHYGLDIGGAEGMVDVVCATRGMVVSAGKEFLPGYEGTPVSPRYDVVYVLDDLGWLYRYSHLKSIDAAVRPGREVALGAPIGVLGKEGGSGGWSHLHFDISSVQPSGKWGIQEGYAFIWEAYVAERRPAVIAVARPHCLAWTGEKVVLDGTRSWSASGRISSWRWTFCDGGGAGGPIVEHTYARPGVYSEVLEVSDGEGRSAVDFAFVDVVDREHPDLLPPSIHAASSPTSGVGPGVPVTFKVRTFGTTAGRETWDFGDGSAKVEVRSDGNVRSLDPDGYAVTTHAYAGPGRYLARVERADERGWRAVAHLSIEVEEPAAGPKGTR